MRVTKFWILGFGFAGCLGVAACSSDSDSGKGGIGTGGVTATGGEPATTGGEPATMGGAPTSNTGGATATGGTPTTTGGAPTTTGGAPATGGEASTGGTPSTGGAAPIPDGGTADSGGPPYPPNPGTVDVVVCKDDGTACSASENCCYTRATSFPTQTPASFACDSKPCTGGDIAISCDGLEDCHGGQQCCRVDLVGGVTSYSCRDKCPSTVVECSGPANCPAGTVCCEHQLLSTALDTKCEETCTGSNSAILCNKKSDCPANAPNCVLSTALPGFKVCQ
jgi:hypothetical protein